MCTYKAEARLMKKSRNFNFSTIKVNQQRREMNTETKTKLLIYDACKQSRWWTNIIK